MSVLAFPAFAHQLAAAPPEAAGFLTTIEKWLADFAAASGHTFDPMGALKLLAPVIARDLLTGNYALVAADVFATIAANLRVIFPASNPTEVHEALVAFHAENPLELAA